MSEFAVSIENIGKRYSIGRQQPTGDGMRHVLESALPTDLIGVKNI